MNGVYELELVSLDWELLDQNHTLDNMNIPQKSERNPRPAEYLGSVFRRTGYHFGYNYLFRIDRHT